MTNQRSFQSVIACLSLIASTASASQAQSQVAIAGTISPQAIANATPLGPINPTETVRLGLTLPLRDQAGLADLINRLHDPGDPLFGKYLTPGQFAARFGPTQQDVNAVVNFAVANGFKVTRVAGNNSLITVEAPASAVQTAFGVKLNVFGAPQGYVFHQPDHAPLVPRDIANLGLGIVGIDNAARAHPKIKVANKSPLNLPFLPLSRLARPAVGPNGTGPNGDFTPNDVRVAYNLNGANIPTGAGETLGLYELDVYNPSDITGYEDFYSLPHVPLVNVPVDGFDFNGPDGGGAIEVTLDIEMQVALAPDAAQIRVYGSPGDPTSFLDQYNQMVTDNLATVISSSWGFPIPLLPAGFLNAENAMFSQMAAQGMSFLVASGDDGAFGGTPFGDNSVTVEDPESQPLILGVGGTKLFVNADGTYNHETTWNVDNTPTGGASEGGISTIWPIPPYQVGVVSPASLGSTTMRNVPDVALEADQNNGYSVFFDGFFISVGGTSAASPLWSAFLAAVNQQRVAAGAARIGFPNTMIYNIAEGKNYNQDFHDIADGSTNIVYPAVTGYDLCTGWGTFIGDQLLNDMAPTKPARPKAFSATPISSTAIQLTWTPGGVQTGFRIERQQPGGSFSTVARGGNATTHFTDTQLNPNTTYTYRLFAFNNFGTSNPATATSITPSAPPAAPIGLLATVPAAPAGTGEIDLSWIDANNDATSFDIERKVGQSDFSLVTTVAASQQTFADTNLAANTTYTYQIIASNGAGVSSPSNASAATTLPSPPTPPISLTGQIASATQINLFWTGSADATGYLIQRSANGGAYTAIGTVAASVSPAFTDAGVTAGVTYSYQVLAQNAGGASTPSNTFTITFVPPPGPAAPGALTAVALSQTVVSLNWVNNSGNQTGVKIQRRTGASAYITVASVGPTITSYQDTALSPNTIYTYQVIATNANGDSGPSNSATVMAAADSISGTVSTVVGASTTPTAGANVRLFQTGSSIVLGSTITDATGNYQFKGIADGGYTVSVLGAGQIQPTTADTTVNAAVNNGAATGINLVLTPAITLSAGLQLISLPYDYTGLSADAATLLGLSVTVSGSAPIATYDAVSNSYLSYPNLPGASGKQTTPGRGYWVREPGTVPFVGTGKIVGSPFTLAVNAGWNMIGNPFTTALPLGQIQVQSGANAPVSLQSAQTAGVVGGPLWGYSPTQNNYFQAQTLQPFSGYWIFIQPPAIGTPVSLIFTAPGT